MQLELDPQAISIIIAATSVVIGVFMSVLSLRNLVKSRQASVFLDFHSQADLEFIEIVSETIVEWNWTSPEDFLEKYGPRSNPEAYAKFILVASFFDSMGKLIEGKLTSAKLVPEALAVFCVSWYEKIESIEPYIVGRWRSSGSVNSTKLLYKKLKELGYRSPVQSG
ncbi:MAG: hypothetical protein JSW05_03445 [Candidatus Thorarchaeota archaeon]|nr:MAG: hypothetical protein JSW05_03445 [Candidatus Thorarchaeota archaeon]